MMRCVLLALRILQEIDICQAQSGRRSGIINTPHGPTCQVKNLLPPRPVAESRMGADNLLASRYITTHACGYHLFLLSDLGSRSGYSCLPERRALRLIFRVLSQAASHSQERCSTRTDMTRAAHFAPP